MTEILSQSGDKHELVGNALKPPNGWEFIN